MRRLIWLLVAVVLLLAAGLLMSSAEQRPSRPGREPVAFPYYLRQHELERQGARRTLPVRPHSDQPGAPATRDPLLAALPGTGQLAVVVEANALRHSPIGELLLKCLSRSERDELAALKEKVGIDPLQDIDRVAVTSEGMLVSGFFD